MKKYMVDARGKQCPIPVVETKKMLAQMAESDIVETLVDNAIAVQNLEKMAKQKQLECSWEQQVIRRITCSSDNISVRC